jgi:uncharacterized repeat protein (TIGR03803 family)
LLHSFEGPPNDGYLPGPGTSLVGTGAVLYGMTTTGGRSTNGVAFKVNTDGSGYQVLHHFEGSSLAGLILNTNAPRNDGAQPYGGLVLSGSNLYGTTTQGGSNGIGIVFRMNTDGTSFQILHHFSSAASDGYFPNGSLVLADSTLYGTTSGGGSGFSDGVVFKLNTDGTGYRVLHSFVPSGSEGAFPQGPLLVVGSTIYGVAEMGGATGSGIAFQLSTNGAGYQIFHTFIGTTTDGGRPQGGMLLFGSALYGMTQDAGANGVGTLYVMSTNGSNFRILHNFGINEGWAPSAGLVASGMTLYGMTRNGGTNGLGSGTIFRINADGTGYQPLHTLLPSVSGNNGSTPFGPPFVLGSTLYGMTIAGGNRNLGCAFALTLSGVTTPRE